MAKLDARYTGDNKDFISFEVGSDELAQVLEALNIYGNTSDGFAVHPHEHKRRVFFVTFKEKSLEHFMDPVTILQSQGLLQN